jgi:hypothetical protein
VDLGGPHVPSPGIAGFFKDRIPRSRSGAIVERSDGGTWHEIGRYANPFDAKLAVDEAIAAGSEPDSLRVVEPRMSNVVLIIGGLAISIAIAIVLSIILS